jgi:Flp pilus assembly pilin Flp
LFAWGAVERRNFVFINASGASMVEYVVLVVLLLGLVVTALLTVTGTVWDKLQDVNLALGS